jgi:hypothetical protein
MVGTSHFGPFQKTLDIFTFLHIIALPKITYIGHRLKFSINIMALYQCSCDT